jgi:hypothetical protein
MNFVRTKGFKYFKNFIIGFGASVVMLGALGKLNNYAWGGLAITLGLGVEAFIFLFLGIIGPEKDYYWEKLYPGLDKYSAELMPLTGDPIAQSPAKSQSQFRPLNADNVESKLSGMLEELQAMSKSLGSLRALQEIDFTDTAENVKSMHNFYKKINEAATTLSETADDTVKYKSQIASLNNNLEQLNRVYGGILAAYQFKG